VTFLAQPDALQAPGQRIMSIQVCRGLAAILVLFSHLGELERKYFATTMLAAFHFGVAGVDLFFVVSGIVIASVTAGRFGSPGNAAVFLYRRLARIYPAYWFYSTIILAAFLYNPLWVNASSGHRVDIFDSYMLIPGRHAMLLMQGWTLSYEIYFYLVFGLLLLLPARVALLCLPLWAALVTICSVLIPGLADRPVLSVVASPLILEFLVGCALFYLYRSARLHRAAGYVMIGISLGWLALVIESTPIGLDFPWFPQPSAFGRPLLYGPFAALFVLGLMELERSGVIRFAAPLKLVGDWSYSIYLCHIVVAEIVGRFFFRFAPHLPCAILFVTAMVIPLVLLTSSLSYTYIERVFIGSGPLLAGPRRTGKVIAFSCGLKGAVARILFRTESPEEIQPATAPVDSPMSEPLRQL
jgi:exopolysaccharide production protein ExoZ